MTTASAAYGRLAFCFCWAPDAVRSSTASQATMILWRDGSAGGQRLLIRSAKWWNHASTDIMSLQARMSFAAMPFRILTTPVKTWGLSKHASSVAMAMTCIHREGSSMERGSVAAQNWDNSPITKNKDPGYFGRRRERRSPGGWLRSGKSP
eukprot:scaffold103895_cov29-Tisochrysis_lutea.AAC.6